MVQKSYEHQLLEILNQRRSLTDKEQSILQRLDKGFEGERNFQRLITPWLHPDWQLLSSVDLLADYPRQFDFILLANNRLYIFEIKNYSGKVRFENNKWLVRSLDIRSPFSEMQERERLVIELLNQEGFSVPVQSILVLINPDAPVEILSTESDFEILTRLDIKEKFKSIADRKNIGTQHHKIVSALKKYQCRSFAVNPNITIDKFINLDPICENCGLKDFNFHKHYLTCKNCGSNESKRLYLMRSICDFGVLQKESMLQSTCIRNFTGGNFKADFIRKVLRDHFVLNKKISSYRTLYYENRILRFEYALAWLRNKDILRGNH